MKLKGEKSVSEIFFPGLIYMGSVALLDVREERLEIGFFCGCLEQATTSQDWVFNG